MASKKGETGQMTSAPASNTSKLREEDANEHDDSQSKDNNVSKKDGDSDSTQ
jgi:hypothetical protein